MIARPDAPAYEVTLISFIEEGNTEEAKKVIELIQAYKGSKAPSLTAIGANDVNFLQAALYKKLPEVAMALLDTGEFNNHRAIIFGVDSEGTTLIGLAANIGAVKVVKKLHALAKKLQLEEPNPEDKIWLTPTRVGYIPLHFVDRSESENNNLAVCQFLIELIKQEKAPAALINHADAFGLGETPLHCALTQKVNRELIKDFPYVPGYLPRYDVIDALLTAGADWTLPNKNKLTPFDYLLSWPAKHQLAFLRVDQLLSRPDKHLLAFLRKYIAPVLKLYKDYIAARPKDILAYFNDYKHDQAGRTAAMQAYSFIYVYFTYQSKLSLRERCIATLELDPLVEPRRSYALSVRADGFILQLTYHKTPTYKMISSKIHQDNIIYLYLVGDSIKIASRDENNAVIRIDITEDLKAEYYLPIKAVLESRKRYPASYVSIDRVCYEELSNIAGFHGYPLLMPVYKAPSETIEDGELVLVPAYKTRNIQKSITSETIKDDELATCLPLYSEKLLGAQTLFAFSYNKLVQNEFLLKQDKKELERLIRQVSDLVTDLSSRTRPSTRKYKMTAVVVPVLAWAGYGAVVGGLIYKAVIEREPVSFEFRGRPIPGPDMKEHPKFSHYECHKDVPGYRVYEHFYAEVMRMWVWYAKGDCELKYSDTYWLYTWLSVGVSCGGAALNTALSVILPKCIWHKQDKFEIAKQAWHAIQIMLEEISAKLSLLPDADSPTSRSTIKTLIDQTAQVGDNKSRDEAVTLFTNILTTLRTLKSGIDSSRKPFSQLSKPTERVIDVVDEGDDDEEIPLLDEDQMGMKQLTR